MYNQSFETYAKDIVFHYKISTTIQDGRSNIGMHDIVYTIHSNIVCALN